EKLPSRPEHPRTKSSAAPRVGASTNTSESPRSVSRYSEAASRRWWFEDEVTIRCRDTMKLGCSLSHMVARLQCSKPGVVSYGGVCPPSGPVPSARFFTGVWQRRGNLTAYDAA